MSDVTTGRTLDLFTGGTWISLTSICVAPSSRVATLRTRWWSAAASTTVTFGKRVGPTWVVTRGPPCATRSFVARQRQVPRSRTSTSTELGCVTMAVALSFGPAGSSSVASGDLTGLGRRFFPAHSYSASSRERSGGGLSWTRPSSTNVHPLRSNCAPKPECVIRPASQVTSLGN